MPSAPGSVPSTTSPTSGPGGLIAPDASMKARASATDIDSIGGRPSSAIISSITCDVGLELADDPVVDHLPVRAVEDESEIVAFDDLVARRSVPVDPAGIGQEHLGLAGDVDTHVPGVGRRASA